MVWEELSRVSPKTGVGAPHTDPEAPFVLYAKTISVIPRWGRADVACAVGLRGASACPGLAGAPQVTSSSSGASACPWVRGRAGQPATGVLTLTFSVEETKPSRFMYCMTERKKYLMFPPKVYFVLCKVFIKTEEKMSSPASRVILFRSRAPSHLAVLHTVLGEHRLGPGPGGS